MNIIEAFGELQKNNAMLKIKLIIARDEIEKLETKNCSLTLENDALKERLKRAERLAEQRKIKGGKL